LFSWLFYDFLDFLIIYMYNSFINIICMKVKKSVDEDAIAVKYANGIGFVELCKEYGIGKLRIKEILKSHNVPVRPKSSYRKYKSFVVEDWKIEKYPLVEGFHYVAKSKDGKYQTNDYKNDGGFLTTYIKNAYGIEIPTLYDRRVYYQTTGNYWFEQWFDVVSVPNSEVKKCPYCDWETTDINNLSGAFQIHLNKNHNMSLDEHILLHPEDLQYFKKYASKIEKKKKMENKYNYTTCPICGEKYAKITFSHVRYHGFDMDEFKERYPDCKIMSESMHDEAISAVKMGNLTVSKKRFVSKYEREIQKFLTENGVEFKANRQILSGKEIDLLVEDSKIGIEFNGLQWHTEFFGRKKHGYHLNKTKICNENGYGLIHIFEDEFVNKKDIVFHKLSHILGLDSGLPKIMGRKCVVKEILKHDAENFLNTYHIQGFVGASVYLGAFYNDKLIGVMSFKNGSIKNPDWELVRFATDYNYVYQGVGSKMFSYFVRKYEPEKIISFADRRWTVSEKNNLYTKLGFVFDKFTPPDYKYYSAKNKENKYKRIHKMFFNKKKLNKKYGFPLTMTETEMAKELGYDRIWDCGLIKYVWTAE